MTVRPSAGGDAVAFEVDEAIAATGFVAPLRDLPALGVATFGHSRLPAQTPFWESATVPGIYFAGTITQGAAGLKKHGLPSNSGAVHGARYNARLLARHLAEKHFDVPHARRKLAPAEVLPFLVDEICRAPELWHQRAYLARIVSLDPDRGIADEGFLPLAHFLDSGGADALAATIEADTEGAVYPVVYVRRSGRIEEHARCPATRSTTSGRTSIVEPWPHSLRKSESPPRYRRLEPPIAVVTEAENVDLKRAILALVGCVLLAAACEAVPASGSAGVPSPSSTLGDPCSLLTVAQVGSAINFTVDIQTTGDNGRTCTWTYADPNNMVAFNTARLTLVDLATFSAMRAATDSGTTITPVASLGDQAFYSVTGTQVTSLNVKKGSRAFTVSVTGSAYTATQAEADEATLAGFVLAQL